MSSRNAYLSKLSFAQSLEPFDCAMFHGLLLLFTPGKRDHHYGSVNKQSHVIFDYRPVFENYSDLMKSIMLFVNNGYLFNLTSVFKRCRMIKIKSLTMQQIREIYDANAVLFARLVADVTEQQLIEEINKI